MSCPRIGFVPGACLARRGVALAVVVFVGAVAGCSNDPDVESLRQDAGVLFPRPTQETPAEGEETAFANMVRLHLRTIQLPADAVWQSGRIWQHVSAAPLSTEALSRLALNGVQVAVGRDDQWRGLTAEINRLGGRILKSSAMVIGPARPTSIFLKRHLAGQTLFIFHPDGTMAGNDYPAADNHLAVECVARTASPVSLAITAVPQIRTLRGKVKFVRDGKSDRYSMTRHRQVHSLDSVGCHVSISEKEFLILGPGPEADRDSSVGRSFFIQEQEGLRYQTLLILAPRVFKVPVRRAKSSESKDGEAAGPLKWKTGRGG